MRACFASYFSAARAPRIARAAARCFDSLSSCSSVRSSSCWIAPSVPTWYCIFCWRCFATPVSVRLLRAVEGERAPRYSLQPIAELHRRRREHDCAATAPESPCAGGRDRHRQDRQRGLGPVEEVLRPDPDELLPALQRQPHRAAAGERRTARDAHAHNPAPALHLDPAARDDEATA